MASGTYYFDSNNGRLSYKAEWTTVVEYDESSHNYGYYDEVTMNIYAKTTDGSDYTLGSPGSTYTTNYGYDGWDNTATHAITSSNNKITGDWKSIDSIHLWMILRNGTYGAKQLNFYWNGPGGSSSWTIILDTLLEDGTVVTSIPSLISASQSVNIGDEATIVLSVASTSFSHIVRYSLDNGKTKITIGDEYRTDTTIKWVVPDAFYQYIPEAKSGKIYLYVDTYNQYKEFIGTNSTSLTAFTVEADCIPELNPVIYDSNDFTVSLTGDSSKLIAYKSLVSYTANATAKKYALPTTVIVKNGSQTLNGETNTFEKCITNDFRFTVVDSRGYSASVLVTPPMIDYVQLTCGLIVEPPSVDGEMTFTINGNYYDDVIGNAVNSLHVYYRFKAYGGEFGDWVETEYEITSNKYTATVTLTGLDYTIPYTVEAYAVDLFGNIYAPSETITTIPVFDWGIGDFSMNVPMTVHGSLTVNGDVTVTGAINGTQGSGGSGGVHYGICETPSDTTAKLVTCGTFSSLSNGSSIRVKFGYANNVDAPSLSVNGTGTAPIKRYGTTATNMKNAWVAGEVKDFVYDGASWIMVDGNGSSGGAGSSVEISYGSWTPVSDFTDATYTNRQGWYQKVGPVVTIGFYVQMATTGGVGANVAFTGLPFKPLCQAAGGGDVQGISANYVIYTHGVLMCDVTAPSHSFYTAGTICYMTNE